MRTVADALDAARQQGLARIDAQMLLLHTLGRGVHDRAFLLAHDTDALSPAQSGAFLALVARRLQHEPMAYLLGFREFFGLRLQVDARVLDPRPDTETLVEWALHLVPTLGPAPAVIDLGTGSGATACAIAHRAPQARVWASDASADALAVAGTNAQQLHLPIRLAHGSWLDAVAAADQARFDLIVSNPPYIREGDPHLPALRHEPISALTSGTDGLDALRALIAQAPARLAGGGWLLLEHGHDQAEAVRALLQANGFTQVQSRTDLAGIPRCSGGQWRPAE